MSGQSNTKPLVVFGHILKTAGSTFKTILWHLYPAKRIVHSMNPKTHQRILGDFVKNARNGDQSAGALITHAGFGISEQIRPSRACVDLVFVREPVDRTISEYYFHKHRGEFPPETSIQEYLEMRPIATNRQTLSLSGRMLEQYLDAGQVQQHATGSDLDLAKSNLDGHGAVGLTERFDESLLLMAEVMGWPQRTMRYVRQNTGKSRPPISEVGPEVRRLIEKHNELDLELYEYATSLFESQLAERLNDIESRLVSFRRVNRRYARVYPVLTNVARLLRRASAPLAAPRS